MDGAAKMIFNVNGQWTSVRYNVPAGDFDLRAKRIRQERTGTHALISIVLNGKERAWSTFNTDRDEDRVRLANSAFKGLVPSEQKELPASYIKTALNDFCAALWDAHMGQFEATMLTGDPDITPPALLLGRYIIEGGGTILYAPPGQGKSYTALAWAICLNHGRNRVWKCQQRIPLYVNLERSLDSMRWRIARINVALGLDPREGLPYIQARGRSFTDVYDSCRRAIDKYKCEVVFVDSISRAGAGELVKDTTANEIVDRLNGLAPAWVALGHTPRKDPSHVFGSTHFEAGEDIGVQLSAQHRDGVTGVSLQVTKANDIATGGMEVHALEFDDRGLVAIRRGRSDEFPELRAGRRMSTSDKIEEYMREIGLCTATQIADELKINRSNASVALRADKRFVQVKREGNRVFYGLSTDR